MNVDNLYLSCLKMLNDKYNITKYDKNKFINIYNNTYKDNNQNPSEPTNDINKIILIKIKDEIEYNSLNTNESNNNPDEQKLDIESKLKEINLIRDNMNLLSTSITETDESFLFNNNNNNNNNTPISSIQITNNNDLISLNKFRTFIINTNNNNFKITPNIDLNSSVIFPCCICLPVDIKNKTPYLLLSINDGNKSINYTYTPDKCLNNWDIWKPITDNYININLNSNHWNLSLIDYNQSLIDFSCYYSSVIDVLEDNQNKTFSLNITNNHYFNNNNKIKIIKEDGNSIDSIILNKKDDRIIIKKNNLYLNDFINATVFNYNNKCSILFKYYNK